jgi:hypothetical protein
MKCKLTSAVTKCGMKVTCGTANRNQNFFIRPRMRAHGVYLYGKIKGLVTMSLLPVTTYPNYRVQSQGGNLDYYIA